MYCPKIGDIVKNKTAHTMGMGHWKISGFRQHAFMDLVSGICVKEYPGSWIKNGHAGDFTTKEELIENWELVEKIPVKIKIKDLI